MKPHIRIKRVGANYAYSGLYGAMSTIRKGNAFLFVMWYKVN
jgi:hypothetical protein